MPSFLHPEDGGSRVLRNVGILPHNDTVSQPRRRLEQEGKIALKPRLSGTNFYEIWFGSVLKILGQI